VDAAMNARVTAAFVAALAILAAAVVGLDRFKVGQPPSAVEATQAATIAVFKFDEQKANALEVKSGDKTARVEKDAESSSWKVAGSGEAANSASFTSLVFRMSQLKATSRVAGSGADLKQFGLDTPKDEMTAELDDGAKYTLLLGGKTPVGTGTYAKAADADDVYVLPSQLSADIERLVNDPKQPPTPTPRPATTATPSTASPDTTPTP